MLKLGYNLDPLMPFAPYPCSTTTQTQDLISNGYPKSEVAFASMSGNGGQNAEKDEDDEFWKQPDGLGYKPCLVFSREYRRASVQIVKDKTKYLMVVVSGGMNQQRNQIVDAVVIARILGAALVVPILQVNVIWGDERYFSFYLYILLKCIAFCQ